MTRQVITDLSYYWVRVPAKFQTVLNKLQQTRQDFSWSFDYLAKLMAREDLFQLIYEQTICPFFVDLQTKCGVNNITQFPSNILWLEGVKNEYLTYVKRQEDLAKIKENRGENPYPFQAQVPWPFRYSLYYGKARGFKEGQVVSWVDRVMIDTDEKAKEWILTDVVDEAIMLKKKDLRIHLLNSFGYMIWRTHPLTKWALRTSVE